MLITTEFLLTLIVSLGISKYSQHISPDYYTMITEFGKEYNIKVDKKNNKPCPLHCGVDHFHSVFVYQDDIPNDNYHYYLEGFKTEHVLVNSKRIVEINSINPREGKKREKIKMVNVQTYLP